MAARLNLKDQRFGSAVAKEKLTERYSDGSVMWRCQCDCGNWFNVASFRLRSGEVEDCGRHGWEKFKVTQRKKAKVQTLSIQEFLCHHKATGDMP